MKFALLLLCAAAVSAHDSVLFSATQKITKSSPSIDEIVASATAEAPVVFLVNPAFSLAQFSKAAGAYSTHESTSVIVNAAKAASAVSRFIGETVKVTGAQHISKDSAYTKGASVYIVAASDWATLDELAKSVVPSLAASASAFVVTADGAVSDTTRVKREDHTRVARAAAPGQKFPMVQPLDPTKDPKPCLFYLEGLNIVGKIGDKFYTYPIVDDVKEGKGVDATWTYDPDTLTCPELTKDGKQPRDNVFTISVQPGGKAIKGVSVTTPIEMKLTITSDIAGFWELTKAELLKEVTINVDKAGAATAAASAKPINMKAVNMNSVFSWGWNCWDSQAIFFDAGDKKVVGIGFHGIQLAVYGHDKGSSGGMKYFSRKIESCTGTFSAASWMGILTALVMVGILVFGFLMLNSVQTMDRFDDPKQRQIIINVRE